jgi:hypothetical protein
MIRMAVGYKHAAPLALEDAPSAVGFGPQSCSGDGFDLFELGE